MDEKVYLEKLSAFSRMLRLEGLSIGPRETADAAQILIQLGLGDRETVKTALRTVFASSRDEQKVFDRVFDGFFLSEEAMKAQAKERQAREQEQQRQRQEAEQDFARFPEQLKLTEQQRETYAAMGEEARQRLRSFLDKYQGAAQRNPNLYGEFIHSVFAKTLMEQQLLLENAGAGCEAADPELGILYQDISEFRDQDIPKAIHIIRAIAARINGDLSRRGRNRGQSGKLDFRGTIRKGLETGGSFYRLRYRKKPRRKKRLVILCDVSGSMMQFSEFALRFIQSLNQVSENSRTYLFSETMVEADPFRLQNMDTFRAFVGDSGIYGRGTDLGTALATLCAGRPPVLGKSTTLLILSDTKTIDQPRAIAALTEAKRQCGRVLILNPIPKNKWPYLHSVQAMAEVCTMVPCSTLRELAAACRDLSRSIEN